MISSQDVHFDFRTCGRTQNKMLYHAERDHCSKILKEMNSLRKEVSFSDVCLIVGEKKLFAHKWVLVAASDYFRSFFIGPLGDQTTAEIELTPVTTDSEALESVLNFIYTGEIDMNYKHVSSILKIGAYFLMNELRGFCGKFMLENLTVTNCMIFYLLAIDYSFPEVEKKAEHKLRSRIHDFLIYEKSSLEIAPEQLLYLVNHDFFEHCSVTSILSFVRDWVKNGNSEKHESLGYEILDKLCPEELPPYTNDKSRIDIHGTLEGLRLKDENESSNSTTFNAKLNNIISKYTSQTEQDSLIEKMPEKSSKAEQVLITLSPTDEEIDMAGKQVFPQPKGSLIFDLCVYVPRTKSWHHVLTVPENGDFFTELSAEEENRTFMCLFDKIVILCPMGTTVEEYSLRELKWNSRDLEKILPLGKKYHMIKKLFEGENIETPDEEIEVGYRFHSGSASMFSIGKTTCLLLKMRVNQPGEDPDSPFRRSSYNQVFFKCYVLNPDDNWCFWFDTPNDKWSFWFDTPKIEPDELRWGRTKAAFSNDSKEMLIVHHDTKKFFVFLADIGEDGITVGCITPEKSDECKTSFAVHDVHILCANEAFYVVAVGEQKKGPAKVVCRYKYCFNSNSLTVCNDDESKVLVVDGSGMKYDSWYYPFQYKVSESDTTSIWLFGGNTYDESFLKEVTVDNYGSLVIQSHPPPPFSRITAAVPGYMDVDCLALFKPQKTYLTEIDMNTFERRPYNLLLSADSDASDDTDNEDGSDDDEYADLNNYDDDYYDDEDDDYDEDAVEEDEEDEDDW